MINFLSSLPSIMEAETRSITAENPKGLKNGGAQEAPDENNPAAKLGKGWKVKPYVNLKKGSTTILADIKGEGVIQHIWMTISPNTTYRDFILRFYWDDEETPSVEVPLEDFFASCHGIKHNVNSLPVVVNPRGGLNSYWAMPFRERAKISIENQMGRDVEGFYYQITYSLTELPENTAYFHGQWRRSMTTREKPEHVLLDEVLGQGHYVGTVLSWTQFSDGWWGEGEVKFYLDGDEYPTICGTGTEDYFGGAWAFAETYSTPFLGYPLRQVEAGGVPKHGLYRWHILDPIRFKKDLKVTIQALGWWPDGKFEPLTDDIASAAFWYQKEPHNVFPVLPAREERWPRSYREEGI